jgi:hypothetical protein
MQGSKDWANTTKTNNNRKLTVGPTGNQSLPTAASEVLSNQMEWRPDLLPDVAFSGVSSIQKQISQQRPEMD